MPVITCYSAMKTRSAVMNYYQFKDYGSWKSDDDSFKDKL